jgi:hypothetical protein
VAFEGAPAFHALWKEDFEADASVQMAPGCGRREVDHG